MILIDLPVLDRPYAYVPWVDGCESHPVVAYHAYSVPPNLEITSRQARVRWY